MIKRSLAILIGVIFVMGGIVWAQPSNEPRLCTGTSCILNFGTELGFDVLMGGGYETRITTGGELRSMRLCAAGASLEPADLSCIDRDAPTDRLFGDMDADGTKDATESYLDGIQGHQSFYFRDGLHSDVIAVRCLSPGRGGVDEDVPLEPCGSDDAFASHFILFPTGTLTVSDLTVQFFIQGTFNFESITMGVRFRDAADFGQTGKTSDVKPVCTTTGHPSGRSCTVTGAINEVCPYAQCALGVRVTGSTLTDGTVPMIRATVFYDFKK